MTEPSMEPIENSTAESVANKPSSSDNTDSIFKSTVDVGNEDQSSEGASSNTTENDPGSLQTEKAYLPKMFKLFIFLGIALVIFPPLALKFGHISGLSKSQDPHPPAETFRRILDLTYLPGAPIEEKNRTQIGTENAVMFMLVRNFEVQDALDSIRQIEDRFNRNYRYPWVFLNDDDFTEEVSRVPMRLLGQ
ncbi:mannosyltransferase KTR2 [Sugiyamaella lignohabitans]|uniref:Mannosyltransferase KTR2 n=1 Tax=Sugiyamaella lignohabitans TaxID=796027 RepID=A0A167CAJ1_9ASCO|nr:mannosyltransferase KTR2 [Sugiyamaella lignohabitans]ANB11433.1 mannosyltransferase KTR2 [Sugiyamaella lignohabitans]